MPRQTPEQLLASLTKKANAVKLSVLKAEVAAKKAEKKETDLEVELEALRYYRRRKLIDPASFKKEKKKLVKQQDSVYNKRLDELDKLKDGSKKLKSIHDQQKTVFETIIEKQFRTSDKVRVTMGNDFVSDQELLKIIIKQPGQWVIKVKDKYYTLNDRTKLRLKEIIKNATVVGGYYVQNANESDAEFIEEYEDLQYIELERQEKKHQNWLGSGAFFKYLNLTKFDLKRYGIFKTINADNYNDNCLIDALRAGGLSEEKLELVKHVVKDRNIPHKDLKQIADIIKCKIFIKNENYKHPQTYGKEYEETFRIGSLDGHFFIIDKTEITRFSLEHYDEVKEKNKCNMIYKMKKGLYIRDALHFLDSYDVIKILLENQGTLLKPITMDDQLIATTQFYDRVSDEILSLEYDRDICTRPVVGEKDLKAVKADVPFYNNVFFDFETYKKEIDGKQIHVPYLCRTYDGTKSKVFIGENCGLSMLCSLRSNTRLIAHNASYDYRFIIQYLVGIEEMSRGTKLISCSATFNGHKIQIKDSLHLISTSLAKFPEMFKIENVVKEIMPYDLYSEENVNKRFVPINEALLYIKLEDQEQFFKNLDRWGCRKDDTYDIVEYSSRYCAIDCEILCKGYNTFRGWILNYLHLDIDEILTAASLAHKYFISQGCYTDVNELGGVPQLFIQGCVVGGRTMVSNNEKKFVEAKINDFDAVSLYPSAMFRMDGFLKGDPQVIKPEDLRYEFLEDQDGYFVDIVIKSVGIRRDFSLMSFKNEEGVRIFSNDMVGKTIRVDKYTLEDMIEFQGITFDVVRGYYFDDGFNTKIKDTIQFLFNERLKLKKEGNPAEQVYKLIMNSGYGKTIMKPVETETRFFDNDDKFQVYLSRNYNWISSFVKFGTKVKVSTVKTLIDHYNIAQVGVSILSMSKRIMNEVMCLAEDNGCDIYYQDTDSMHLQDCDIAKLSDAFSAKYGRKLIGKGLGQFHSDFDLKGCKDVYASKSIFLGKKCYIDELKGIDEKTGEEKTGFHIRMKGIPNKCIYHTCNKLGYTTPYELYQDLYNGKKITFDLTCNDTKPVFKFDKNYSIHTVTAGGFDRTIGF
jgi:hypothetical protein